MSKIHTKQITKVDKELSALRKDWIAEESGKKHLRMEKISAKLDERLKLMELRDKIVDTTPES